MREQIKFTFQIGYTEPNSLFENAVACAASQACGGCTTSHKTGWWCADGDERKERFEEPAMQEHTFQLELTCEPDKAERVYDFMATSIAAYAAKHCVDTDWVHVSETKMTGRHFSVAAINAASVAA